MRPLALITGAGTGIGHALSTHLISRGCDILAVGRRAAPLQALADAHPGRVTAVPLDIATPDAPAALRAAVAERPLRFVVHNAATLEPAGPLATLDRAAFQAHLDTNLSAPLFITQALLPAMREGARVLHISSGAAHHALQGWGPYCVSKAALHMLTQSWNAELGERGILVGSARPGVVDTPMQSTIRSLAPAVFPRVAAFQQMKAEGALLAPDTVGRFLTWMLLDANAQQFSEAERDIRDEEFTGLWRG